LLNRHLDRLRPLVEMTAAALTEAQEPLIDPGQQPNRSVSGRVFLTLPAVLFMRYLIKPRLLIRAVYLDLLIKSNARIWQNRTNLQLSAN